ncbi:hypothetical protein LZ32DRAFT_668611 [Colletotrichum eremochloae]|nr:hypothetical protein LZ32DRAFT_668611 [Colletotrichum eremochloae]
MELDLKQKTPLAEKVENTDSAKVAIQNTANVIRPRPQHATPLDTVDDDDYDDCWLPAYEDPRPTDKLVDDDWVSVKKPASSR